MPTGCTLWPIWPFNRADQGVQPRPFPVFNLIRPWRSTSTVHGVQLKPFWAFNTGRITHFAAVADVDQGNLVRVLAGRKRPGPKMMEKLEAALEGIPKTVRTP
jgi:hypothetical protein